MIYEQNNSKKGGLALQSQKRGPRPTPSDRPGRKCLTPIYLFPRSRSLRRRHRSEAPARRYRDQYPQCCAGQLEKIWPSKKKTLSLSPSPQSPLVMTAGHPRLPDLPTRDPSTAMSRQILAKALWGNCRLPGMLLARGLGTGVRLDWANALNSQRAWLCSSSTRPSVSPPAPPPRPHQHIFEWPRPCFIARMASIDLLAVRTVVDSKRLQMALGKVRLVRGFSGRVLAIDPIACAATANDTCAGIAG